MANKKPVVKQSDLVADNVVTKTQVIHPALDWTKGQLIVGVVLKGNKRAVLSSEQGFVLIDEIGRVCELGGNFASPVTGETVDAFQSYIKGESEQPNDQLVGNVLAQLASYLRRFVFFPEEWWPEVIATWILGTYVYPIFPAFPYLHINSDKAGAGKSVLGQVLAGLSFNGRLIVSPTEANLFHLPEMNRGVQVWDEFEISKKTDKARYEAMKSILLCGYKNGGAVIRQRGKDFQDAAWYHVFCPRVLIGLSNLPPGPARDRTIKIKLRGIEKGESVDDHHHNDQFQEELALANSCVLVALRCASRIREVLGDPELNYALGELLGEVGRQARDIWRPLFAVAAASCPGGDLSGEGNPWLESLAVAAKELQKQRKKEAATQSNWTASKPAQLASVPDEAETEWERLVLREALGVLEWHKPITPTELAQHISTALDREVTSQWLSKKLTKLRVRASKTSGRRRFNVSPEQVKEAKALLKGNYSSNSGGTAGQDGQQEMEEGVGEEIELEV